MKVSAWYHIKLFNRSWTQQLETKVNFASEQVLSIPLNIFISDSNENPSLKLTFIVFYFYCFALTLISVYCNFRHKIFLFTLIKVKEHDKISHRSSVLCKTRNIHFHRFTIPFIQSNLKIGKFYERKAQRWDDELLTQ